MGWQVEFHWILAPQGHLGLGSGEGSRQDVQSRCLEWAGSGSLWPITRAGVPLSCLKIPAGEVLSLFLEERLENP